jgi:hypothetical protein
MGPSVEAGGSVMAKSGETKHNKQIAVIDPDPVAILTICIATISMLSAVTSTIKQLDEYKRRRRKEERELAVLVARADVAGEHLMSLGSKLKKIIAYIEHDVEVARSFLMSASEWVTSDRYLGGEPSFVMGVNTVVLTEEGRRMWNVLIDDVCAHIKDMNRYALNYATELQIYIGTIQQFISLVDDSRFTIERDLYRGVLWHADQFQILLTGFSSTASDVPMYRVLYIFEELCHEANSLVRGVEQMIARTNSQNS